MLLCGVIYTLATANFLGRAQKTMSARQLAGWALPSPHSVSRFDPISSLPLGSATSPSSLSVVRRQYLGRSPRAKWLSMTSGGPPETGKFVRMGSDEDSQGFGNRCVLIGGLNDHERNAVQQLLEDSDGKPDRSDDTQGSGACGSRSTPIVPLTSETAARSLGDLLSNCGTLSSDQPREESGSDGSLSLPSPVILVSGFTNTELRVFAARFRQLTGIRAAFAKAVPNAMPKNVRRLCEEISRDHSDAMSGKL